MADLIDADTDYIAMPDNTKWTWTPVDQDRFISFWMKSSSIPDIDGEEFIIFGISQAGGNKARCLIRRITGIVALFFKIFNSSDIGIANLYFIHSPDGSWHHYVINLSSLNNCEIWIDGVQQTEIYNSWDDNVQIDPNIIRISNGSNVDDDFTIAHFIWGSGNLSANDIEIIRWNPWWICGYSGLLCYYPMDEWTGTNVRDFSESSGQTATDGTLTNTPTWADDPPVMMRTNPIFVARAGQQFSRSLEATTVPAAVLSKKVSKILDAAITGLVTLSKKASKALIAATMPISVVVKQVSKVLDVVTVGLVALAAVKGIKVLLAAVTVGVALVSRLPRKVLSADMVSAISLTRTISKGLIVSVIGMGSIVKKTSKSFAVSCVGIVTLVRQRIFEVVRYVLVTLVSQDVVQHLVTDNRKAQLVVDTIKRVLK